MEPFGLKLITAPAVEPVTRTEAKAHLRIDGTDQDTLVDSLVAEAREAVEGEIGRALVTQTWSLYLDGFPGFDGEIRLPRPPLQSVTWIKYYDEDGTLQTFPTASYWVAIGAEPGRIWPVSGVVWPTTQPGRPEAVEVRFVAGYGLAAAVPNAAKAAVKLIVGDRYMNPGDAGGRGIPPAARRLLSGLEVGEQW